MITQERRYRAKTLAGTIREQGRTVSWLARRVGFSRQYTSDVVHGHIEVREEVARRMADAVGVPLFLLFVLTDVNDLAKIVSEEVPA